jgi:putative nucleotidyltransferase with HDIG domain
MENEFRLMIVQTMLHSARVAEIASLMAESLNGAEVLSGRVSKLSYLHDIGKVMLDPKVLNKKSRLNRADWAEIRKHPVHSHEILKNSGFSEDECLIVRSHHEKLDGSGYPCGYHNIDKIPVESQIITVADIFDALTSERIYRSRVYSSSEAIRIMKQDPGLNQGIVSILEGMLKTGKLTA